MNAYETRGLVKMYASGVMANDGITLQIAQGEIFGVLGPNGAGKSTLVRQMVGLSLPTRGSVRLMGRDVRAHDLRVRRTVGFLSQRPLALMDLRASEAVACTGMLRGLSRRRANDEAHQLLSLLGMEDRVQRLVGTLSGGEHRLVGMATALIGAPPVLVLDEPTNELDPVARARVWDALLARREQGTTIILVTHNVLEAERVVSRVAILAQGRVAAIGTPGELKEALHQLVRIEVAVRDGTVPTALLATGTATRIGERRWRIDVDRKRLPEALGALGRRGAADLDDLRVQSASLEDVYVAYHAGEASYDGTRG
ncbi:MAG: ABC transporter ATP-binding protein [Thermaerobacter sp.]|nr:ABC transporter ATP-binding protein [Thermaerobacter sp.]